MYIQDSNTIDMNRMLINLDVDILVRAVYTNKKLIKYTVFTGIPDSSYDYYSSGPAYFTESYESLYKLVSEALGVNTTAKLLDSLDVVKEALVLARKMDLMGEQK